jgi:hypothetical protein
MSNRFHARLAAAALLKMAKTTADPELAAHFVRLAADLKDHTGELPVTVGIEAPDVHPEHRKDIRRAG